MLPKYEAGVYRDLADAPATRGLWPFLNEPESILKMELASRLGRPAVEGLEEELLERFGDTVLADRVKQMIGHMARQVMERHGWRLDAQNVKINNGGPFSRGSRYRRTQQFTLHVHQSASDAREFALTREPGDRALPRTHRGAKVRWISRGIVKDRLRLSVLYGLHDADRVLVEVEQKGFLIVRVGRVLRAGSSTRKGPSLFESIRRRIEPLGGVDLPDVPDEPVREPPKFD